jgi:arylmalonate decarboxylase
MDDIDAPHAELESKAERFGLSEGRSGSGTVTAAICWSRNVAVATAYNEVVNDRLRAFLTEHDFNVLTVQGLGIEAVEDIFSVTQPQLIDFGADVVASSPGADSLLVSCGGLRTLEILAPLERRTGVPAISSTPHALFAGAKLLQMDANVAGYGRLLSG